MARYWISFDLGLHGDYDQFYGWLDRQGAKECGDSVATFVSDKTRDQITKEILTVLGKKVRNIPLAQVNPRIYIISLKEGGKFIFGKRKFPPWKGYAEVEVDSGDER